jgi:hypothetical protein
MGTVTIRARAKMGTAFQILKVTSSIDGLEVFSSGGAGLQQGQELDLFKGTLPPGEHTLVVVAEYKGDGHRVFSYFDGYRYRARSSTRFQVQNGEKKDMTVDLSDKGGANTAFEDRLAIAFVTR